MTVVGTMQAFRERGLSAPDDMALVTFRERGLSAPDDMALVCFDEVEHLAVLSPFLTVIDQPADTFGSLGARCCWNAFPARRASVAGASCFRLT
ncbi:substrate-binding domain-containing protein [Mesorhizobium denitrificans]|uniref:Transcriptional regulator LacI/GalR-like sensor domain-containing protein n=1 Tax=Mesorhizobium denitrificans TaxID=2294114 RepID=A0A371X9H5_9HYPH|nr:substrate-binding domain-containing protein [Mesorhizobium denitrificans]RFC65883.1 hypothetical protein DY251_16420 [Mesorhizobium denitrificans]